MKFLNKLKPLLGNFIRNEDGFLGAITAGLGLASSIFGNKSARKQTQQVNQGFNYLRDNSMVQGAQASGQEALDQGGTARGLQGALLGLGGDQAAAEQGFEQYRDSTGYNFRLDQGMQGIEGSRAARGILNSGATAKELTSYGQDMASQEFGNYMDQLSRERQLSGGEANMGLQAALGVGSAGSTAGAKAAAVEGNRHESNMGSLGGIVRGISSIFGF